MTTAIATIIAALKAKADGPVVERRGRWLTGTQLLTRIWTRADEMSRAGLRPGGTALIIVSDNLLAMETLLGCWVLGAAGCFVDFRTPPERIAEWAERLDSSLVIGRRPVAGLDVQLQNPTPSPCQPKEMETEVVPNATAIFFASSGTTGLPKLLPITHSRLGEQLRDYCAQEENPAKACVLSAISIAYSASNFLWLRHLAVGKTIVALDLVYSLDELDAALRRPDVTECSLPPILIRRLAALPGDTPRYPQLTMLGSVGGPASEKDKIAAVTRLSPHYRMTYSCVGIGLISNISGTEILERPASCGKPADGVRVTILDGLRKCAPNEIGEISISKESVVDARPGDLGWLDEEGYIYIAGRVQGLFCKNGANFSADRLTLAALDIPKVIEVAAISQPGPDGGDIVHLFVQCEGNGTDGIARHLRQVLPTAEQPDHIHIRDDLPMNASGKVDLRRLAAEFKDVEFGAT